MPQLAVRTRSGRVESLHDGYICVTNSDKNIIYSIGNPNIGIYLRSSGKPLYAVALVDSGAIEKFDISLKEFAITCSSHDGTAYHRRIILSLLDKIGLSEKALDCGHKNPENQKVSDALIMLCKRPTPIFSNCSGKHSGFLALCQYYKYPVEGYVNSWHPVNQLIKKTMAELLECDIDDVVSGTDGCTLPTYFLTLQQAAWLYARLGHGQGSGYKYGDCFEFIKKAMVTYPKVIRGSGTFCTDLLNYSEGRAIGKIGAEGVYCIAIPEKKLGVCIKMSDGHPWSSYPVAVRVLEEFEILDRKTVKKLEKWALPPVKDDKGNDVGYIHPTFSLLENKTSQYEPGRLFP